MFDAIEDAAVLLLIVGGSCAAFSVGCWWVWTWLSAEAEDMRNIF